MKGIALTFASDGEVERQIFGITIIVLQEDEPLVQFRIQRSKIVQEALLAKPLHKAA